MSEQIKIQAQLKKVIAELNDYQNMIDDFIDGGEPELKSYKKIYERLFTELTAKLTMIENTTNQLTEGK